jgi:large subunit ribosomal protein L4
MIEIPIYSRDGKKVDSLQVDEQLLGGEVRPALLKQAYVMYHANRRQGTAATRGRARVEGSTRKLYRQKGTGNARVGNIRTNIRRGGGVAFAKQTKDWRQSMPAKMRRLATRNALLSKAMDGEIKLIDDFKLQAPKTKAIAQVLDALAVDRSCLLAIDPDSRHVALSARNIADLSIIQVNQLNAYDLLSHRYLLVEKDAFARYIESLKPAVPQIEEAA